MTVEPAYHDDFGSITLDVEPYTGWNWTSAANRDAWTGGGDTTFSGLMRRMRQLRSEAEWRSVLDTDTDRCVAIVNLNHSNMEEWVSRAGEHNLQYRTIRYNEPYDGFAHSHRPTSRDNPRRLCYGVVARSSDLLDAAEEACTELERHEKHEQLGELLGFPSCCRQFFQDVWLDAGIDDPMYEVACNTSSAERINTSDGTDTIKLHDPSPWVNVLWRYFQLSFITHIPCSFDCEASKHVAYNRGELMLDVDEDAAKALKSWLDQPHSWSGHNAIAHVKSEPAIAQTQTSPYLQNKRIIWKDHHSPGGNVPGGQSTGGVTAPNIA